MTSTFHGLEVAKRALFAQQAALYTTSHNIANANTDGYTRQRVNFDQVSTLSGSRSNALFESQIGSGVEAGSIERVRDKFLDLQYRGETSKLGYYGSLASSFQQMEEIMNEPSDTGLSKSMDKFWQALQDLSVNPEDSGARSVVVERGIAVAETFNYLSTSLSAVRTDLENEIDVTQKELNSILNQINNVNQQISEIEPHGYLPNDLYDERDRLIDQLSNIVNVKVSYDASGGQPNPMAGGLATIELVNESGDSFDPPVTLVDGPTKQVNEVTVNIDDTLGKRAVSSITVGTSTFTGADFTSTGKMQALVEAYGYQDAGTVKGEFPQMLDALDELAFNFANEFNAAHRGGFDLEGNPGTDFFTVNATQAGAATSLDVLTTIKNDEDLVAASSDGTSGDGQNALALGSKIQDPVASLGENTSVKSYYASVIGKMAVDSQEAIRMESNAGVLQQQVLERRQSVSAVSLDEEMTNMITFQHAYNAAARSLTAVDEMLDRIINNMGIVGR
ncbi:flagellar hook-associated protein FlgK [Radiobacillus kanasensis]|uniref:flagellar hook-associated protein FlgK n=1 Tax=Radiobacillus kanasensis TaxID=2844358 RepID=UPI001E360D74|nr:flagellar hook-associated protein FlgK [Radiobacillus kanasensis]UFT98549.1 flagellar hook-associated protein FlgK [Radiobacillus kanasensis]